MPIAETFNDSFDTDNNQESIQQMDAATFFPLMLQAQDLVTKLESRVVELENDLETINEAHEQERDQLLQEIGEKDEYIHNLKKKVSRLEFGAREAIIVLARTVETLKTQNDNDDDYEKEDDDNATAVESTDLEGQFLDSIKLCLNYLKNAQNYQKASKNRKKRSIPIRRDSKLQQSNDEDYDNDEEVVHHKHETNTKPIDDNDNDTSRSETIENVNDYDNDNNDDNNNNNNDIDNDNDNIDSNKNDAIDTKIQNQQQQQQQLLSSPKVSPSTRRVSISSSQISLEDIPDLDDYDLDGDEDIAAFNISEDEGPNNFASKFRLTPRKSIDSSHDEEERRHLEAAYAMTNNNRNTNYVREPEEIDDHDDDDIGNSSDSEDEEEDDRENVDIRSQLPPQGPIPNISHTDNSCPNCSVLLAQVDQHLEERAYLKRDLSALAISLSEEQGLRAQIQAGKESLEQEIDDWLNAMFEKVNQMVFDEANTREEIELLSREYKGKMEHLLKGSNARQDRLRELKLLLVHLDSAKQRQAGTIMHNGSSALNRNSVARRSIMSSSPANSPRTSRIFGNLGHMSPSIFSSSSTEEYGLTKGKRVYIDGVLFEEFQEYIKSFITSPAPSTSNPTHSFMKRCMAEDIQPCLFEGSTGWKSPFYKRRLLDAIMKNQCEIQTIYYSSSNSMPSTPISSQISNNSASRSNSYHEPPPAPKVKCGLCGHLRSCDFRMRLSGPDAAIPPSTTTITSSTQSSRFSINSNPGWIPLDRFCRDRVVAVCDFYSYLSHLRQGLLNNSPVWGMYKQCLKYRRKMGTARVGSVSMFEEEENISNEILNNSEMEAMVVLVH